MLSLQSQNVDALTNQVWGVQEYYSVVEGTEDKTYYYQVSGTDEENIHHFNGWEYDFYTNGTLNIKANETLNGDKPWEFFSAGDSISFGTSKYKLVTLTPDQFIIKSSAVSYGINSDIYIVMSPSASLLIDDKNIGNLVEVYPNPAKEVLNIKLSEFVSNKVKEIEVKIYSFLGKNVIEKKMDVTTIQTISTANLPNGIYFVKILDDKRRVLTVHKIIVRK